ncbi:MAG TPA: type 4a pilus biogenesis protein PilO [Candidatus Dormibacteraeota bacterium]|nr:type 4a pilus biogenesis protein PilO [Candidatus Dormibacteraeota bacterium]
MAFSFREFPWYLQLLVFTLMALLIFGLGEFVPFSPVQSERVSLEQLLKQKENLQSDVTQLQVYERRYADFKRDVEGLQKQLDTLKTIVPEEKELDEFIRLVQGAASASNVQIRRLVAEPVVPKEYHYEMPFQIQADGPYFNILDFFSRMSRLSRIINVGDLQFDDPEKSRGMKYPVRPGSTVSAVFVVTTYFTKIADTTGSVQAVKAPGKQPGKP